MSEKRRFMRFDIVLDVLYNILGASTSKTKSCLKNISKEGLRLTGANPMKKGALVELEMKVPGDNMPIFAFGEVAWSSENSDMAYDAGIKFTKIKAGDRARLLDHVYDKWIKSKRKKRKESK